MFFCNVIYIVGLVLQQPICICKKVTRRPMGNAKSKKCRHPKLEYIFPPFFVCEENYFTQCSCVFPGGRGSYAGAEWFGE